MYFPTGPTLARIWMQNITMWNAPEIKLLNSRVANKLPNSPIRLAWATRGLADVTQVLIGYLSSQLQVLAKIHLYLLP